MFGSMGVKYTCLDKTSRKLFVDNESSLHVWNARCNADATYFWMNDCFNHLFSHHISLCYYILRTPLSIKTF